MNKMSKMKLKTTHHKKNQKNHNLNEKKKSTDAKPEMNQMLEWSGKDFKAAFIKMLLQSIINSLETNKKLKISAKSRSHKKTNGNYRTEYYNTSK